MDNNNMRILKWRFHSLLYLTLKDSIVVCL